MATGDLSYIKLPNADELTIKDPNAVTSVKDADNTTYTKSSGVVSVPSASTSARGVTKLSSATDSTSEALAATPKAVKTAYDLANTANTAANSKYSLPSGGIPKSDLASAVQTSLGLADTALQNHQTIKQDGVTGATVNRFGTCSIAAGTAAKTVSITTGTFTLEAGARVTVKFSNANTANSPTLNVNSTGAKNIFHKGAQITTGANKGLLAGTVDFIYDGTQYHLIGNYIDSDTNTHRPIQVNGSEVLGNNTTPLNLKEGSNVSISNSSGTVTIAATDTTYSSKSAASGGTEVSLCTTGEKYTWNNKGTYSKPSDGIPKTDLASAVQTSLGLADTALQNHQTIKQDGVTGATVNRFGTCGTAAGTAAKTVSITNGNFSLEAGARVSVKFTYANTAGTPTLNVNSTGAKNIYSKGSQITSGSNLALLAGTVDFIYDGTQWHLIGNYIDTNTTYSNKSPASGGTEVSLCTTGEKYTWNNKSNLTIGTSSTQAAAGNHTHDLAIQGAASGATANVNLAPNTIYTLTAGGKTYNFKTPADNNTNTIACAYCDTAAGTAAKTASCSGYALLDKSYLIVTITNANSSASALTLNVNGKGAKTIYINGSASSSSNYTLPAGTYIVYYSTYYYFRTDGKVTTAGMVDVNGNTSKYFKGDGSLATPSASDVGAVPTSRTVNNKALSGNITLSASDVGAATSDHVHGSITNGGAITASGVALANGDSLAFVDSSDSSKIKKTSITFDGSTTTKALTQAGTWATFNNYSLPTASDSQLGGVKIGSNISNNSGTISLSSTNVTNALGYTPLSSHQTIKQDGVTGATVNRFGTCGTAAGTAAKTVSVTSGTFNLEAGARVSVKFTYANTAGTPTLNVNSTGAKNIYSKGSQITTGSNKSLLAGTVDFIYDGTQYHLIGNYIDSDTNTHRPIQVNGNQLLGNNDTPFNLSAGGHVRIRLFDDEPNRAHIHNSSWTSCSSDLHVYLNNLNWTQSSDGMYFSTNYTPDLGDYVVRYFYGATILDFNHMSPVFIMPCVGSSSPTVWLMSSTGTFPSDAELILRVFYPVFYEDNN